MAGKKEKTLHLSSLPRSLRLSLPFCCPAGGLVSRHVGCLSSDGAARGLVTAAYKKINKITHDSLLVALSVVKTPAHPEWPVPLLRAFYLANITATPSVDNVEQSSGRASWHLLCKYIQWLL